MSSDPTTTWSVIIVSFDAGGLLDRCVASVQADAPDGTEVLVVDNASSDGSAERVAALPGVRLVANTRNMGFPRAVNQGLALVGGDLVTLLNPDAVLPSGFFEAAMAGVGPDGPFDLLTVKQWGDPELEASVGPLLTTGEILRQVVVRRRGRARLGPPINVGAHEFRRLEAGYLSGFCLTAARETFRRLEGFDPALFWAEDVDLSARAVASGRRLGVCTSVEVHHEQTHSRRRHTALVTFFQMTAKIGYARRHAPGSVLAVAIAVGLTAAGRYIWFRTLRRTAPDAAAKVLAYRAVVAHILRRGWRMPDGWDPAVLDRLRGGADA